MKKLLFIGNRAGVFIELQHLPDVEIIAVLALRNSYLHAALVDDGKKCEVFSANDKDLVVRTIADTEFDILVSNGCPFILPISQLRYWHQLFLNVHPSLLPEGRGRHPINGALLQGPSCIGATLHYMDDGVDTGNIVHQECVEITDDLDLGLLYQMSFKLEARVFREGMLKLVAADYRLPGKAQSGKGSYYTRQSEHQQIDLVQMCDEEIVRRVRAFGVRSQGVTCSTGGGLFRIFEAEPITNLYLREQYAGFQAGQVLLRYEDRLLLKTREGIIKVKSYVLLSEASD